MCSTEARFFTQRPCFTTQAKLEEEGQRVCSAKALFAQPGAPFRSDRGPLFHAWAPFAGEAGGGGATGVLGRGTMYPLNPQPSILNPQS